MGIFMSAVLPAILTMVISYLLGSINSSIIFTKLFSHEDIREMGSGNAGTTNVLRSVGKRTAACTFAFDFIKGVLAVFIGRLLFQYFAAAYPLAGVSSWEFVQYGAYLAGIFCVLGHDFPVFFGFRGGKGVLTSWSIILLIDWRALYRQGRSALGLHSQFARSCLTISLITACSRLEARRIAS